MVELEKAPQTIQCSPFIGVREWTQLESSDGSLKVTQPARERVRLEPAASDIRPQVGALPADALK